MSNQFWEPLTQINEWKKLLGHKKRCIATASTNIFHIVICTLINIGIGVNYNIINEMLRNIGVNYSIINKASNNHYAWQRKDVAQQLI